MKDLMLETGFTFDSREVKKDSIFIALSGGLRDGNDFAKKAFEAGAKFLILSKEPAFQIPKERYIVVQDTLNFITELAKNKFEKLLSGGVKTVALTGSIGKTTTKDFLAFLIKKTGAKVFASKGNFNNHIGVPISILNAPEGIEFLVLEMGMNHPEEISHLIKIAPGNIRIITTVTNAHSGNFADGLFGIAKAKAEILENSNEDTHFITKKDLEFLPEVIKNFKGKINYLPDISGYKISNGKTFFKIKEKEYFFNKTVTQNWLTNILIGFEVLNIFKLKYPEDISSFVPPEGRGDETKLSENCTLIDESYNASPEAMLNAISTISLFSGKKLLVLGGMKELGEEDERKFHDIIILETIKHPEIEVIFVGYEFKKALQNASLKEYLWFETPEDLIENFNQNHDFNFILAKSSNSSGISKFTAFLKRKAHEGLNL